MTLVMAIACGVAAARDTRTLFETGTCKAFANVNRSATRKLAQLDAAQTLESLRSPPGNRLKEYLCGCLQRFCTTPLQRDVFRCRR